MFCSISMYFIHSYILWIYWFWRYTPFLVIIISCYRAPFHLHWTLYYKINIIYNRHLLHLVLWCSCYFCYYSFTHWFLISVMYYFCIIDKLLLLTLLWLLIIIIIFINIITFLPWLFYVTFTTIIIIIFFICTFSYFRCTTQLVSHIIIFCFV